MELGEFIVCFSVSGTERAVAGWFGYVVRENVEVETKVNFLHFMDLFWGLFAVVVLVMGE